MKAQIARAVLSLADALIDKWRLYQFHPHTRLMEQAQAEAAAYADEHMKGALIFRSQADFLRYALRRAPAGGLVMEFGVATGSSITLIAKDTPGAVHGFDSFEGLPEDWAGRHEPKGAYSTGGRLPRVPPNVKLHKGWFDKTLPAFLGEHADPVSFLHVDCDLYSSTRCVLQLLTDRVVAGTVIVFDEYFNYVSWREHEFKAFREFVDANQVEYEYIAWSYQQAAVLIRKIRGSADAGR